MKADPSKSASNSRLQTTLSCSVKMSGIIEQLRKNGEEISNKSLSYISLLLHKHVIPMGTYFADGIIHQLAMYEV